MAKRTRNTRLKRSGETHVRHGSAAAEPVPCDYCGKVYWRTDPRQRYCNTDYERKPATQRRAALVELLLVTLRARCGVTLAVVRRMVEAAERALLEAVRRLGWVWCLDSRRFELKAS